MCNKRNSVNAHLPNNKVIRCDSCIRRLIELLNLHGIKTVACCCGHMRYPITILIKNPKNGKIKEMLSGIEIPRKRNFYRRDSEGFFFIPEICSEHKS